MLSFSFFYPFFLTRSCAEINQVLDKVLSAGGFRCLRRRTVKLKRLNFPTQKKTTKPPHKMVFNRGRIWFGSSERRLNKYVSLNSCYLFKVPSSRDRRVYYCYMPITLVILEISDGLP